MSSQRSFYLFQPSSDFTTCANGASSASVVLTSDYLTNWFEMSTDMEYFITQVHIDQSAAKTAGVQVVICSSAALAATVSGKTPTFYIGQGSRQVDFDPPLGIRHSGTSDGVCISARETGSDSDAVIGVGIRGYVVPL